MVQNNTDTRTETLVLTFLTFLFVQASQVFGYIQNGIEKELTAMKQPFEEAIVYVGSSQCSNVKNMVGVSYEQMKGEKEPDLNSLTLVHKTRTDTKRINITDAEYLLQQVYSYGNNQTIVFFIHGFTDGPTKDSFIKMSLSYFQIGYTGLIALDGSPLIHWLYLRSTTYVRFIGRKLGELLAVLIKNGLNPSSIHIIGHSLGAHIAGFVGKTIQVLTGLLIGRITGLDPAGPCFNNIDPELRLNQTDAFFVDVIHTDAGVFGIKDPVGHRDFYPNSGYMQPKCVDQSCSHSRSWLLYDESVVQPEAFPAVQCEDWEAYRKGNCSKEISFMGYPAVPGSSGKFFLQTNGEAPFGRGDKGLQFQNEDGIIRNIENFFG